MITMKNPIAITPQLPSGRKLPDDFMQATANHGGLYDRRNLSELWKDPKWSGKTSSENLIRDARLSTWTDVIGEK
jgi:hypothetical protein